MVRGPGSVAGVVCCLLRALQCMSELVIICALMSFCAFPVVALGQEGGKRVVLGVRSGGRRVSPRPRALAAATDATTTHDHGCTWTLVSRCESDAAQWAAWCVGSG